MKSALPASSEPTGAESPLETQKQTESASAASTEAGTPRYTAALKSRAPSRCTAIPRRCAKLHNSSVRSGASTVPQALLWVFSRQSRALRGKPPPGRRTTSTSFGSRPPSSALRTVRTWTLPRPEAEPASLSRMCERLPTMISSPRPLVCVSIATRLLMVPEAQKRAASLPRLSAAISSRWGTVGSSPRTSSPTSARYIASRIARVGWVTVSLRRSMMSTLAPRRGVRRRRGGCRFVEPSHPPRERARPPVVDERSVDRDQRHHAHHGIREERLVGAAQVAKRQRRLSNGDARAQGQLHHRSARDAGQGAILDRRRQQLAASHG